ncbi:MAG: phytochelatin synthase [Desulfosarcina sp.]|nr:phytochelatin synthase [Desulfosarcina sp.]MBC2742727.1 phytochelatin synthase [Desulfosarcina sp.]MBC2765637.1 phytochelatin synthase [Desulfosarcina sp.]
MNLLRNLIRPYLYTRYGFHRMTGTGAFRSDRIRHIHTPAHPRWNPLKLAIWKYHVKQFDESSCSVAAVVSCINAIRSLENDGIVSIGQREILDRVTTGHWKARMSDGGYRGRRGLPLPLLGQVVKDSIAAYELKVRSVDIVQTPKNTPPRSPIRTTLKKQLRDFDRHGNGLILAHFDQGTLVPTLNIPHISPVGAYDAATDRVTMLDVDPEQEKPYQVNFDTFFNGLSCNYHHVFEAFEYGSGGYVHIQIR